MELINYKHFVCSGLWSVGTYIFVWASLLFCGGVFCIRKMHHNATLDTSDSNISAFSTAISKGQKNYKICTSTHVVIFSSKCRVSLSGIFKKIGENAFIL